MNTLEILNGFDFLESASIEEWNNGNGFKLEWYSVDKDDNKYGHYDYLTRRIYVWVGSYGCTINHEDHTATDQYEGLFCELSSISGFLILNKMGLIPQKENN